MSDTDLRRVHRWSADQWKLISPYLDQALDLEPQARSAWLDQLAAVNPTLAEDLRELLATHDKVSSAQFLDHDLLSPVPDQMAGQKFGAYSLETLIGSSGRGSVWLGSCNDAGVESKAAIRILDHGGLGHKGADQIRRATSLLAQQAHTNIARMLAADFTADGQAYLILEYVEGVRIDEYCNRHALSLDARLDLLLPVIDAVAHAHSHGIVHRDLKPANILVTPQGVAKLLDLGVASLISRSATLTAAAIAKTAPLAAGPEPSALGVTPAFAAPEQIRGEEVTPASDIYALGILLYLLLTGRHPFAADSLTHTQIIRAVLTEDAPLASEALDSDAERRRVRGDLDAIAAKAIYRDAEHRYASAADLAADIRRFRATRPVAARGHNWAERIGMFARRNFSRRAESASFRVIRKDAFAKRAWKNGGGVTYEAIRVPSSDEPFLWRVSLAHIEKSGPFSDFAGYQRRMLLLQGRGLNLTFGDGRRRELRETGDAVEFDGAMATHCDLLDGPCMDLNLMTAKSLRTSAKLEHLRGGSFVATAAPGQTLLVFSLAVAVALGDEAGGGARLNTWDLAVVSRGSVRLMSVEAAAPSPPIAVFIATISQ